MLNDNDIEAIEMQKIYDFVTFKKCRRGLENYVYMCNLKLPSARNLLTSQKVALCLKLLSSPDVVIFKKKLVKRMSFLEYL